MVKVVLSGIATLILLSLLQLMVRWQRWQSASRDRGAPAMAAASRERKAGGPQWGGEMPWPRFPGAGAETSASMVLNGVQIINHDWQTAAPAVEVIAYYKGEMAARGWRDVTEATFHFQPEFRDAGPSRNGLQDEQYLRLFRATIDSTLVMIRGGWSLEIRAFPSSRKRGETTVSMCAAATPSLTDFFLQLASSLSEPVDVVQENGGERYHTTVAVRNELPAPALRGALADLGARGWRPAAALPAQPGKSGYFVWLVKGAQYGVLSIRGLPDGRHTSVALTEVTPAAAGRGTSAD